ncbi:PTS transporter subunit EIIC [Faecalibacterium gallinarum]|uniref:PTS beta-glucoside transporter subunit EIIBCA n=1 Tax=Faecalibacterium gallinarum TaxID=2903556 RepID=A0AA37J0P8_9FIRM|nr:PTS transporter subunit EIIC [Faecalibacterium gallinarum]GJN65633.1 hypothetical protein JCM17207_22580 [Faecalibacterium gallinarum]
MDYRETGLKALEVVGGKDNVKNLTHCATRLRFEVKDRSKVDLEKLNSVPGVLKALESAGQFQFVIGPSVNECYQAVADEIGIAGGAVDDNHPEDMAPSGKKDDKGNLVQKALGLISGIFIPVLPALIASGMIKALLTILTRMSLVNTESGVYTIITFVADSVFYFLPVLLAATSAKVFGMSQGLAMMLGAMLLHPTFSNAVSAGTSLDIFGLSVRMTSYSATVIPIILIVWVASYVEKFGTRFLPDVVKYVFRPLLVMIVMIPLSFCVLGPIGAIMGDGLAALLTWLQNTIPWLLPTFIGTIAPLMVLFGLNNCTIPLIYAQMSAVGYETVAGPGMLAHNIAEGAASLALALKSKDTTIRQEALTTSFTALFGGITEPAIYGFTLRFKNVLPCVMIGGAAGGLFAGLSGLVRYATAAPSIVTLPTYMGEDPSNIWKAVATLAIAFVVTFVLVFFVKTEDTNKVIKNDAVTNELK